jgi:electron transport complex protein RnfG
MKEMLRYGFILSVICLVASGLLAGVNSLTKKQILLQAQAEEENSLKEVLPEAESFQPVTSGDEVVYYKAKDKEQRLIGVAFKTTGKGYSSDIVTMVGMSIDGTIKTIKVLSQNETPGLGARVSEEAFTNQFKNKRDLNEVSAITGATISSRAVIEAVKKKARELQALLKNNP